MADVSGLGPRTNGSCMKNYLVTGAAGFIGSALVRALVQGGENIRALDDFSTGKPENLSGLQGNIDLREVSLLDSAGVAAACTGIDCVFHQAALPSVPKSVAEPKLTNSVNIEGTLNLLLA